MKCPQCPYYIQETSYGKELIKCCNEECLRKQKARDRWGVGKSCRIERNHKSLDAANVEKFVFA